MEGERLEAGGVTSITEGGDDGGLDHGNDHGAGEAQSEGLEDWPGLAP